MNSIYNQYAELSQEWLMSIHRAALISLINDIISSNPTIQVQAALCLGLGSLENSRMRALPYFEKKIEIALESWEDQIWLEEYGTEAVDGINKGNLSNVSLYQLLIFQTTLETLKEKFPIDKVYIQDPAFTLLDQEFLEQQGYTVIPYPNEVDTKDTPCDLDMLSQLSNSTFFFAPGLPRGVVVEVVHALQPLFYLGHDLIVDLSLPLLVHPGYRTHLLMPLFTQFISTLDFETTFCLGNPDDGFMWVADMHSIDGKKRMEKRAIKAIKARELLNTLQKRQVRG